jgi:hypothetical protein
MNTRKYPRTLTEAFGPYADGPVEPMREDRSYRFATWAMYVAAVLAIVVVVGVAK